MLESAERRDAASARAWMPCSTMRGEPKFNLVAAWSVDRLGRSLPDLLSMLGELEAVGCDLYLDQQAVEPTTPAGRALFQMMGVFAEFERAMIRERVMAGLATAKDAGKVLGRPRVDAAIEKKIAGLLANGMGQIRAAKTLGCGVSTVQRVARSLRSVREAGGGASSLTT